MRRCAVQQRDLQIQSLTLQFLTGSFWDVSRTRRDLKKRK